MSHRDDMVIDNGLMSDILYTLLHVPLSRAQAPQRVCVLPSASMVIQYRGASLLTMQPKRTAFSANSSDSHIANMSSTRFLNSCTAESPLNRTRLTDPPGASMTIALAMWDDYRRRHRGRRARRA